MTTSKVDRIAELEALVAQLTADVKAAKAVAPIIVVQKSSRADEALAILLKHPMISTDHFARLMQIQPRNMQSVVHALRNAGWNVPKGSPYSLQVNDQLVALSKARKLEQFMVDRIDEYEAIKAFREARAAKLE